MGSIGDGMTPEHELDSDGEDEAPEELTFQNARTRAEESARLRRDAATREKTVLKEKRKRKHQLFSEQKKKKLLSDDILQSVSSLPDQQPGPSGHLDESKEKDNVEKERQGKNKPAKKLLPRKSLEDSYKVVLLNDDSTVDLQQQKAKRFMHNLLYGKGKNRTTANEFLSISRKNGVNKKPAAQFTDNSWGEEEKRKAAKFNLLRANRQHL